MNIPKLDRLITLRAADVWANEPHVFTPWLSRNLDLLAEALQLDELELKGTEIPAGDFRLDILAEDQDGLPVIIENQFGNTDHKHLGQLISYVASLRRQATVVWVAERFKEDHRAAIDWLNENTSEEFNFFALEIEALRIGNSEPAPFFNVVAKPNNWARSVGAVVRQSGSGELSERDQASLRYWAAFADYLKMHSRQFQIRRPIKRRWARFGSGRSGVVICPFIGIKSQQIGVELYLSRDPLKLGIHQLSAEREAIEAEFGETLEWQELVGKKASRIVIYLNSVDPVNPDAYPDLHAWMLERMERFRRVFEERLKLLKFQGAGETPDDEVED